MHRGSLPSTGPWSALFAVGIGLLVIRFLGGAIYIASCQDGNVEMCVDFLHPFYIDFRMDAHLL